MTLNITEMVEVYGNDSTLKADGYDDCVVGIECNGRLVYDKRKMLDKLERNMSSEEAMEFFEFNVVGAWVGEETPIFVREMYDDEN